MTISDGEVDENLGVKRLKALVRVKQNNKRLEKAMDDATVAKKEKKEKIRKARKHEIIKSSRLFIVADLVDTVIGNLLGVKIIY